MKTREVSGECSGNGQGKSGITINLLYDVWIRKPIRCHGGLYFNPLTPNDHYRGRTAPLTSKRRILYIY